MPAKKNAGKKTARKTAAKERAAKKTGANETAASEKAARKTAKKKTAANKAGAKTGAKKTGAKRTGAREAAAETGAQEAGAKKAGAKKTAAKKADAKKTDAKKTDAKKTAAKKITKKAATKEAGAKKAATKEAATKEAGAKKAATKKAGAKKAGAKKAAAKKPATGKRPAEEPATDFDSVIDRIAAKAEAAGVELAKGASAKEIAATEKALGLALPAEVVAFYRRHDGSEDEPAVDGRELLSLSRIVSEWKIWKDLLDNGTFGGNDHGEPDEGVQQRWWIPEWVPFTYDGSGNHHVIDLAPAEGGTHGQVLELWHDEPSRTVVAKGLLEWLEEASWGDDDDDDDDTDDE